MSVEFISKEVIDWNKEIDIPCGTCSYNYKSGEVLFYFDRTGKHLIQEGARSMSFPHFSRRNGNIKYGEAYFT